MSGYKVLAITDQHLSSFWRGEHKYKIVKNALPKDAKFVRMLRNKDTHELEFIIFSETYAFTKPGRPLPYVAVPLAEGE